MCSIFQHASLILLVSTIVYILNVLILYTIVVCKYTIQCFECLVVHTVHVTISTWLVSYGGHCIPWHVALT